MRAEDVCMCIRHGADIVGFVVEYPRPVPWNLSAVAAKGLIAAAAGAPCPQPDGGGHAKTCVVTGGLPDKVLRVALEIKPDYIQLHCNESLEDTAFLARELGKYHIKIIKTLFPDTPDMEKTAADFLAAGAYALLLDPRAPDNAAHGGSADIAAYIRVQRAVNGRVILAGGITPENAAEVARKSQASILDLMTGVEQAPGIKDEARVIALFSALRGVL
jgi:phosphoribosylanthranilate isomerase